MLTKEQLEGEIANLQQQMRQATATVHALDGAIQFGNKMLALFAEPKAQQDVGEQPKSRKKRDAS